MNLNKKQNKKKFTFKRKKFIIIFKQFSFYSLISLILKKKTFIINPINYMSI